MLDIRVPQVVETNLFTLCPLQGLLHPAARKVERQWSILFHRRREHPPGVHSRFVIFKDFQQRIGQNNCSDRGFGFRLCDVKLALDEGCGLGDPQFPSFHIQIVSLQSQNFTQPQASSQLQQEQFIVAIMLRLDEKPLHFLLGEDIHFAAFLRRQLAADGWIDANQAFLYRFL